MGSRLKGKDRGKRSLKRPRIFVDASGETIILVGLEPGPHKVLIELADPTHKVITSETVKFTVPDPKKPKSRH